MKAEELSKISSEFNQKIIEDKSEDIKNIIDKIVDESHKRAKRGFYRVSIKFPKEEYIIREEINKRLVQMGFYVTVNTNYFHAMEITISW